MLREISYRMRLRAEEVRHYRKRFFLRDIPDRGLVLLPGIRGVGKSVALLQLYREIGGYLFWVDEVDLFYGRGIVDLLREIEKEEGKLMEEISTPILLDEVQYDPRWPSALKWLADVHKGLVIATGSSALAFQLTPELGRRAKVVWVWPLSFYEWLHLRGKDVDPVRLEDLLRGHVEPKYEPGFEKFLKEGGLPVTLEMGLDAVLRSLERLIFHDMVLFGGFDRRTVSLTPQLIRRLAVDPGMSVERMASEVGLSKPTVISVLNYLERAGLIIQLRPYGPLSSIRKGLKRYFVSPTLRYALVRPSFDEGLFLEEYVASQLKLLALRNGWELTFWPDEGPDFVLIADEKIAVEVGLGRKGREQVRRALDRVDRAIVISEEEGEEDRIRWIPISSFWRGI